MKCDEGGFLGLLGWGGGGSSEGRNRTARCGTRRGYVPVGSTPASLRVMVPHLAAQLLLCPPSDTQKPPPNCEESQSRLQDHHRQDVGVEPPWMGSRRVLQAAL